MFHNENDYDLITTSHLDCFWQIVPESFYSSLEGYERQC